MPDQNVSDVEILQTYNFLGHTTVWLLKSLMLEISQVIWLNHFELHRTWMAPELL